MIVRMFGTLALKWENTPTEHGNAYICGLMVRGQLSKERTLCQQATLENVIQRHKKLGHIFRDTPQ